MYKYTSYMLCVWMDLKINNKSLVTQFQNLQPAGRNPNFDEQPLVFFFSFLFFFSAQKENNSSQTPRQKQKQTKKKKFEWRSRIKFSLTAKAKPPMMSS